MNKYICTFVVIFSVFNYCHASKKVIRVAVIDTGLDLKKYKNLLCKTGHKDFTNTGIKDRMNHGTLVVENIKKAAGNSNYCLIILKYYDQFSTVNNYMQALEEAIHLKVDVVNYSGGGNNLLLPELAAIELNPDIKFFVSAGNNGANLDENCFYYPACLNSPNMTVVGAMKGPEKANYSNYGLVVDEWEEGFATDEKGHISFGTSFSTPTATGKYIRSLQ